MFESLPQRMFQQGLCASSRPCPSACSSPCPSTYSSPCPSACSNLCPSACSNKGSAPLRVPAPPHVRVSAPASVRVPALAHIRVSAPVHIRVSAPASVPVGTLHVFDSLAQRPVSEELSGGLEGSADRRYLPFLGFRECRPITHAARNSRSTSSGLDQRATSDRPSTRLKSSSCHRSWVSSNKDTKARCAWTSLR